MKLQILILCLIAVSCGPKEIKHSGQNTMVVGIQQIILYEDHRFYLELSLGGTEGNYKIRNDTVFLNYDEKPAESWPEQFLIKNEYFESIGTDTLERYKIRRER